MKQIFESDNISFVEVSERLVPDYLIMVNDYEHVNRFIGGLRKTFTEDQEIAWVRGKREENAPVFSMIEKESGRFIGNIELMDLSETGGELGIAITAEMQDKGYGTEAVKAFIAYAMERWGLRRIFLRTSPGNARAIRVYEKCGFREYDRSEKHVFMEVSRPDPKQGTTENKAPGSRIIILGSPGSGKSTFARGLQERTGLPLFHLDNIWWRADRTHISRDEFDRQLQAVMQGGKWILDGDYSRTYEVRFQACDTVIFLDFSEEVCLRGIAERLGRVRPDIPWSEDRPDPELEELVRKYRTENRPEVYALIEKYPDKKVFVFRTREEADAWLKDSAVRSQRSPAGC